MEWLNKEKKEIIVVADAKKSLEINTRMSEKLAQIKKESALKQAQSRLKAGKIILNS